MKRYYEIIEKFGLQKEFAIYLQSKSINAPYHNLWHTINMIEDCYECYNFIHDNDIGCLNLIVAAIFHDINHTQGKFSDDININIALQKVKSLPYDTTEIQDIIKATQYPYVIPAESLNELQKIIRDADLMSSFKDTLLPHCLIGISKELNIDMKYMLVQQKNFIENAHFNTEWGQQKFNIFIEKERDEIRFLNGLF